MGQRPRAVALSYGNARSTQPQRKRKRLYSGSTSVLPLAKITLRGRNSSRHFRAAQAFHRKDAGQRQEWARRRSWSKLAWGTNRRHLRGRWASALWSEHEAGPDLKGRLPSAVGFPELVKCRDQVCACNDSAASKWRMCGLKDLKWGGHQSVVVVGAQPGALLGSVPAALGEATAAAAAGRGAPVSFLSRGKEDKVFQSLRSHEMDITWRWETRTPVQTQFSLTSAFPSRGRECIVPNDRGPFVSEVPRAFEPRIGKGNVEVCHQRRTPREGEEKSVS